MNIRLLKNIMKEINEPNEFVLQPSDLQHPLYWIFKVENVRVKTLFPALEGLRKPDARFDVFLNGLYISTKDYIIENNTGKYKSRNEIFAATDNTYSYQQLLNDTCEEIEKAQWIQ